MDDYNAAVDSTSNGKEQRSPEKRKLLKAVVLIAALALAAAGSALALNYWSGPRSDDKEFPWHKNIMATQFWVGEAADESNDFIHNSASAWKSDWVGAYGGVDDPNNLCGYKPCDFAPNENPFYAAVPYNDLDEMCQPKSNQSSIYWYNNNTGKGGTLLKNRWIQINYGGKTAYAQIEDVGPFESDDVNYVFGDDPPKESRAGLDLSPATIRYLGINGRGQVDWRFIDATRVSAGPWNDVVTKSGPDC